MMEDSETQDVAFEPETVEPQAPKVAQSLSVPDQQRMSLWILTQRDRPMPSLEDMKKFLDLPDELSTRTRLEELNEQFEDDLQRLYMGESEDQLDELNDAYYSMPDEKELVGDDIRSVSDVNRHARKPRNSDFWDSVFAHTEKTYNMRMAEIRKHAHIHIPEMNFPQSIEDYRQKPREMQQRVAKLLLLESDEEKEKMFSEFSCGWRHVMPLQEEFEANAEFQTQIRAVPENTWDPRRR